MGNVSFTSPITSFILNFPQAKPHQPTPSDFADEFPGTEVIGLDISAQQPQWIPPNLKFELDDITRPWTYDPDTFDYIHMRWLVGAIPDWTALYKEIFFTLKPGGYFENKESSAVITSDDGTVAEGSALDQWGKMFGEAGKKCGRTFRVVEEEIQRKAMAEAGFVDVVEVNFKVSVVDHVKNAGRPPLAE